jgi:hypothetical protein
MNVAESNGWTLLYKAPAWNSCRAVSVQRIQSKYVVLLADESSRGAQLQSIEMPTTTNVQTTYL